MKPPYAHASRTALAVVAAAGTIWLSAFFLPGAVVEPIPLLPAIGSAAGRVVSVHEPAATKRAPVHTSTATLAVAHPSLVTATFQPPVTHVQPRVRAVQQPRSAHHPRHHRSRPKHVAPVAKTVPASAPASPPARSFDSAAPPGRALGWHRKHDQVAAPSVPTPVHGHGHGQGHGHGHATSGAPAAPSAQSPAAPVAPPSDGTDGHDNGRHLGDEHDHGDQGNGPGGKK